MRYLNIIIIDDDQEDCELLEQAIGEVLPSASCTVFNNAEFALSKLRDIAFESDIVFLDLNMPRMDGLQFLEVVREQEHLKNVPIIIFSTSPLIEVSKSRLLNVTGMVEKPESFEALVSRVREVLA